MKLALAKRNEEDRIKQFWKDNLAGNTLLLDKFFEARREIDHCYIAKDENGNILSMLHCLQQGFTREMHTTPTAYIVGAATRPDYQRQGLMNDLLELAYTEEHKILTINPGFNPYFLNHGFYTAAHMACFRLTGNKNGELCNDSKCPLETIYINATEKSGALDRDSFAWDLLKESMSIVFAESNNEKGYALVADGIAYETMCEGLCSARALKEKIEQMPIQQVWMPSDSPMASLFDQIPVLLPIGMSNETSICAGVYIAQQL